MTAIDTQPTAETSLPLARTVLARGERADTGLAYSIGTLVNDMHQYEAMRTSFAAHGFSGADCEFLLIDNSGPAQTSAYAGLNAVLTAARGRYVILCHQDVRLIGDGRAELDRRLAELTARDATWALAGNAGGVAPGDLALRISDPHGTDQRRGKLPARVAALDENFIVVRGGARVGFSRDLDSFHFYGADICLAAATLGYSAYVIDFHLQHLSGGKTGDAFRIARAEFCAKWSGAIRPRWLQTTCSLVRLSGGSIGRALGAIAERPIAGLARRWHAPPAARRTTSA